MDELEFGKYNHRTHETLWDSRSHLELDGFHCDLPAGNIVHRITGDDGVAENLRDIVTDQQFGVVGRQTPARIVPLILLESDYVIEAGVVGLIVQFKTAHTKMSALKNVVSVFVSTL